jgi:glycosyltransferase involved in cell wall biosynthesis
VARLDLCPGLTAELRAAYAEGPDVVHLHTPNPAMALALAAAPPPAPLVITHHSDIFRQKILRTLFGPVERLVYARAARVLATSPAYAAGSPLLRRHAAKAGDLPLGLDLGPYLRPTPAAAENARLLRRKHGWPLWLFVGRLVYYKGLHTALDALVGVPGKLAVVGTGPLEKRLRRRARALGVDSRVVWLGAASADELAGAYRAAAALWFPSCARSEGFGLVQVEAMASGCPVLNTAVPDSGVGWVCRHGREGLTVPVGDAKALARAANRLLDDPVLRERLGENARARAVAEFGHETMARRSLAVYRGVLGGRPAPDLAPAGVV